MAKLLSGKEVASHLNEDNKNRVRVLQEKGIQPCLCIIRIGENPGDMAYERGALARCKKTGVSCRTVSFPADVSQEELLTSIQALNEDASVHGVLFLRPLPRHMDEAKVVNSLRPEKDVDGMTDLSMSGLLSGRKNGFAPCTPEAAMAVLEYYGIDCTGKRAVVIGRSLVFGKPAALMLTDRNATVTVCHTKTIDLPAVAREADLIMTAAGHAWTVRAECVREGQTVIDVGINEGPDHKLCGDAAFEEVEPIVAAITPVPGGVGAVTTSILVRHTVEACERQNRRSFMD